MVYVDVLDVGTPQFPRETYLKTIKIDQFDFYIIVACNTFTENDLWLATEIKRRGKNFLLLRTKIDVELRNQKEDYPDTYSKTDILDKIRKDCTIILKRIEVKHIYLISNQNTSRWDFPYVRETLVKGFPELKGDAVILSLRMSAGDTKNLILLKKRALQRRAALISLASAAGGAVSLPGISALVDLPLILHRLSSIDVSLV